MMIPPEVGKELLLPQVDRYMDSMVLWGMNHRFIQPREPLVPDYFFCNDCVPLKARVVIYGAGAVGKSYVRQIRCHGGYEIAGWVDKYSKLEVIDGYRVLPIASIIKLDFEYVIAAIKAKETAEAIKKELAEKYSLDEKVIIWSRPVHIFDYYGSRDDEGKGK